MNIRQPSGYLRRHRHLPSIEPLWQEYERLKTEYLASHPDATPTAYEAEMRRIARECGV